MENYSKFRITKKNVEKIVEVFGSTREFRHVCAFVVIGYKLGFNPLPFLRQKFNIRFRFFSNDLSIDKGGDGFYFSKDGHFLFLTSTPEDDYIFWQSIRFLPKN